MCSFEHISLQFKAVGTADGSFFCGLLRIKISI